MVMPDAIAYLVAEAGLDKKEAERQVREALRTGGYDDAEQYWIDYSTVGGRWGKGRWQIIWDDGTLTKES
jgi:hypothetical protein